MQEQLLCTPSPEAPRRLRRTRTQIEDLLAEFESSGLTQRAFCQLRHISLSTLSRHLQRRLRAADTPVVGGQHWVEVEVAETSSGPSKDVDSGLAITLPVGVRIEIARGFDAGTLRSLLHALETR